MSKKFICENCEEEMKRLEPVKYMEVYQCGYCGKKVNKDGVDVTELINGMDFDTPVDYMRKQGTITR